METKGTVRAVLLGATMALSLLTPGCEDDITGPTVPSGMGEWPNKIATEVELIGEDGAVRSYFGRGEAATIIVRLTNQESEPVSVTYSRAELYDLELFRLGRRAGIHWRMSEEEGVTYVDTILDFEAGETKTFRHEWDGRMRNDEPVSPGEHAFRVLPYDYDNETSIGVAYLIVM